MRIVVQRVSRACVRVGGEVVSTIGRGLLVLAGVEKGDTVAVAERAAQRISTLRVFEDAEGRMNLGLGEIGGEVLVVSQFTLAGSIRRGRRPSFDSAAPPDEAEPLFQALVDAMAALAPAVATGVFRARMDVELVNDGPVTFIWEDRPAAP